MTDRVAAEKDDLWPARGPDILIEVEEDFRVRATSVVERPSRQRGFSAHFKAPAPKHIVSREVMLD